MAKPFVKWVGGKRKLVPDLLSNLPVSTSSLASGQCRYFEPFLGGGALFFALQEMGLGKAFLNDFNPELTNLYRVIQKDASALSEHLASGGFENTPEAFAAIRAWDRQEDWPHRSPLERAARFIYLNRTAFNGLWRVNSKGHFNTPYGRYKNPGIPSLEVLTQAQAALAIATLTTGDFEASLEPSRAGDFVYFDPPYAPLSVTANFVGYTSKGFDDAMQQRLANTCQDLTRRGVAWMLSNSDTPYTREVFGEIEGAQVHTVQAARAINRDGAGRGKVSEVLVVGPVRVP